MIRTFEFVWFHYILSKTKFKRIYNFDEVNYQQFTSVYPNRTRDRVSAELSQPVEKKCAMCVVSLTNPRQDKGLKMKEEIQKLEKSGMKYTLIPIYGVTEPSIDFKSNTVNWFFTLLTMETEIHMADL